MFGCDLPENMEQLQGPEVKFRAVYSKFCIHKMGIAVTLKPFT